MSNRTIEQASALAALKVAHAAQIEALLARGISERVRFERFARAADFRVCEESKCFTRFLLLGLTAAAAAWENGIAPTSLFANLPGCACPVLEQVSARQYFGPLIPLGVEPHWKPTRAVLEEFARVQQEARFPGR